MITLKRTGDRALSFDGEILATASTRGEKSAANRWHEVAVYETKGGAIVVAIQYRTQWEGEVSHDYAEQVATVEAAVTALRGYDPCAYLLGYPLGEHYAQKQERLRAELRLRYEHAISEVLSALEPEHID